MRYYFRYRLIFDWVIAFGSASAIVIYVNDIGLFASSASIDGRIFLTTGTMSATLLGFSLAAASFLVAHTNSESMTFLRNAKSFPQLISLLQSALWRFFGIAIISLLAFSTYHFYPKLALLAFLACAFASVIAAVLLIWSVSAILRLM